jgi:glyoxylase-like metal-dependent hydrolase (beta-lactamase superfamily II)
VLGWPFAAGRYPPFEPDRTIADALRLDEFGVAGEALHTPGHTDGSLSIVLDSGDAIAGDLLAGALFDPDRPDRAFFHGAAAPTDRIDASLRALLDRGATRLFLGHGGPVRAEDVRAFIDRRAVPSTP